MSQVLGFEGHALPAGMGGSASAPPFAGAAWSTAQGNIKLVTASESE